MRKYKIVLLFQLFSLMLFAQEREITGTVTDNSGSPLPGVSILLKGTTTGTSTDFDGNFSINASEGDVLEFSFVGMKTFQVTVGQETEVNVSMEDDFAALDEVVVVGYGTQKKSDITGSVVSFDTDILKERPQTNLIQALQGSLAGVSVTTSSSSAEDGGAILIRGNNSITASNNPLIIVDGIPYDGGFSSINPNDVESMEVLKDASSTAIYGSQGANGVILISTKKGKGAMTISYNGHYSTDEVAHMPDMDDASQFWASQWERDVINQMSNPSSTTADLYEKFEAIGWDDSNGMIQGFMQGYPGQTWDQVSEAILANYPAETHKDRATLLQIARDFAYPAGGRNTDWIREASRMGHKQQHNVSISGSTDKMRYYVSGVYDKAEGIALGDDFERMKFRVNMSFNLTDWLTYGTNTQFGFYDRSGIPANWLGNEGAFELNNTLSAYNEDGSIDLFPNADNTGVVNPLENLLFLNEDKETRITTNHYIDVDVPWVEGLHYKLNTGYSWNYRNDRTYLGQNTIEGAISGGELAINNRKGYAWTVENILSYERDFGKHHVFLTALYSAKESVGDNNGVDAKGFPSDDRTFYQASAADVLTSSASFSQRNYISQMFRANYGFDSRYLLTGTVRRDGYSAFGDDTKFGIFPSVAVGWNIANENFMEEVDMVDALKLRLSYGVNGNDAIGAYRTLPRLSSVNYIDQFGAVQYGYFPQQLSNPSLGWETTESFNIGLDYTLSNGRVRGTIDAYRSNTYDLLLNETISAINGTTSITRNIGETKNKGIEFQISTVNVDNGDFSWRTDFNGTAYKSEIVNVGLKDEAGNFIDDVASEWFIGHSVDVNYDYVLDRILQKDDFILDGQGEFVLDDSNRYQLSPELDGTLVLDGNAPYPGMAIPQDTDGDLTVSDGDKVIIADRNPDFIAGMANTFKYKNWTFSFFLNSVWGLNKKNGFYNNENLGPERKISNIPFWTPENPTTTLPGLNKNKNAMFLYPYYDVNFVRIQDITLSYKFEKIEGLSNLEVFTNVKNLYTFTNWKGLDPEYDSGEDSNTVNSNVPRARSIILGVRMSF